MSARRITRAEAATVWLVFGAATVAAQPAAGPPKPARSAREAAPVDFTGYWVSPVMEDWRWRMVTPLKGDFANIPVNAAARKIGEAWDPAADEAAGLQCKAFAAPAIMRVPGRLRISWQDDNTLKIETDQGTQTRLLRFGAQAPQSGERAWQGFSAARWEAPLRGIGDLSNTLGFAQRIGAQGRSLEVVTTRLRAGYLRRNGIPFSENALLEEFFDYHKQPDGSEWFTVTTVVTDPTYLVTPFITSTDFKKERDGSGFRPTPCSAR
jgi:hypothetical protein